MLKPTHIYIYIYHHISFLHKIKARLPAQSKHLFCEAPTFTQSELPKLTLMSLSTIYSPLVFHGQYRAVCERRQILHAGQKKPRDYGSTKQLQTRLYLPMLKPTPTYVYIYHHIPFLYRFKAQLTTTYGQHTASILSVRLTNLTQPELPKLTLMSSSTIYSPLVHHGQYRAVCAILHAGKDKARDQGSTLQLQTHL